MKKYEVPAVKVMDWDVSDIITSSSNWVGGDEGSGGGDGGGSGDGGDVGGLEIGIPKD